MCIGSPGPSPVKVAPTIPVPKIGEIKPGVADIMIPDIKDNRPKTLLGSPLVSGTTNKKTLLGQ